MELLNEIRIYYLMEMVLEWVLFLGQDEMCMEMDEYFFTTQLVDEK